MKKEKQKLGKKIYRGSHITGKFILRSGIESAEYFDKYLFETNPVLLKEICLAMNKLIPKNIEILAGLEMGGIPLVTMLSQYSKIPSVFVRKLAKEYGTCKLAEGGNIKGKKIVIIEDVVTSGGQIILSVKELHKLGAEIEYVLCVIDRESGGVGNLAKKGLKLKSLFTMSELKESIE